MLIKVFNLWSFSCSSNVMSLHFNMIMCAHTARFTRNVLIQNNINVLQWPANSPDCNPIECMRDVLGHRLRQCNTQPQNVHELTNALQDEWARIPCYLLRNQCCSMGRQLKAVTASDGGHYAVLINLCGWVFAKFL